MTPPATIIDMVSEQQARLLARRRFLAGVLIGLWAGWMLARAGML